MEDGEPARPPELPGAALRTGGSSEENSPREEDDPDRPPKPKTHEDQIYDKIDFHVERIEQHDAILAQAQKELAAEIERGRAKKRAVQEKFEREDQLRKEAGKRAVEQAKQSRRRREQAKRDRQLAKEQRERDEYALAVWAATKIQSGYRGRRERIYGNRRRVVVLGATGQIGSAVCRHSLLRGFEVVGMSRDPSSQRAQALVRAGVRVYKGDMDNPHDVDRVLAFAVHGSEQQHTNPHTHVVGQGHVHGLFIMTPHWHDDGGPRGATGCAERELQRARNCIDAARRARVTHVVLSTACAGGWDAAKGEADTLGQRSETYTNWRFGLWSHPRPPEHIVSKAAIESYLEETLGPYPNAKPGLAQALDGDATGHIGDARGPGGAANAKHPTHWTILRPVTLIDNFWSWQTPWCHVNSHVRMPISRWSKQQLVWSDDVGAVAARAFDEGDVTHPHARPATRPPSAAGLRARAPDGRLNWFGLKLELVGDELTGPQIAKAFDTARRDPHGRGAPTRGWRKIRYVHDLPPLGRRISECECVPASCACIGEPCAWGCCLQLQEYCGGWDDPHLSFAQKRFVESGGGGAVGGEQLRAVLPTELHTLHAALTMSGWGERPNPEWTSSVLFSWLAAPWWSIPTLLCPCCVAGWTAKRLYRSDAPWAHALLCGCLWPCSACQLRTKTREEMHIDHLECGTWGHCDTATVCCFPWCTLVQQAREVYSRTRQPPRVRVAPDYAPPLPPLPELPKTATAAIVADAGSPDRVYQSCTPPQVQKRKPRWAISESLEIAHQHESEQDGNHASSRAGREQYLPTNDWGNATGGMMIGTSQNYGALSQQQNRPGSSGSGRVPLQLSYQSDTFHTDNSMVEWRKREAYHGAEGTASLESSTHLHSQVVGTEEQGRTAATVAREQQEHAMGVAADALGRISWKAGVGGTAGETGAEAGVVAAGISGGLIPDVVTVPAGMPAERMER